MNRADINQALINGSWLGLVEIPPRMIAFTEAAISVLENGRPHLDIIAQSSFQSREACEAIMRKGGNICGLHIAEWLPDGVSLHSCEVQEDVCRIAAMPDVVAAFICTDIATGVLEYRAILRREVACDEIH